MDLLSGWAVSSGTEDGGVTGDGDSHLLKPCRSIAKAFLKDFFQRLMVVLHMHNITPKEVLVKLLARKHNGQELLDLSIPGVSLS